MSDDDDFDDLLDRWGLLPEPTSTEIMEDTINGAARGRDGRFAMSDHRLSFYAAGFQEVRLETQQAYAETIGLLCDVAKWGDPFEALESVAAMRRLLDLLEHEVVAYARTERWSWRQIAKALQVSAPSAHRRFARVEVYYRRRRNHPPG